MQQNLTPSMTKEQFDSMPGYRMRDFKNGLGITDKSAYKLLREIKSISDIMGVKGFVLREDYENFVSFRSKRGERQ